MVNHCFNPNCLKPLHYLREGKIYVFDIPDSVASASNSGAYPHHMEHFWLCGPCSQTLFMEQTSSRGVRLVPKAAVPMASESAVPLAS